MGMESAGMDWRQIRRARSCYGLAASRSYRAASGTEISRGESLAHREVAASGDVRFAARLVGANDGSRRRPKHPGVSRIPCAEITSIALRSKVREANSCSSPRRSPSTSRARSNGRAAIRVRQGSARFKIVSSAKSAATTHTRTTFSTTLCRRFIGSRSLP